MRFTRHSSLPAKATSILATCAITLSPLIAPASVRPTSPTSNRIATTALRTRQNSAQASAPMIQMPMVFPLFVQNRDFSSTLVLTNAANQSTYADVILTATNGSQITTSRVQFTAHSQRTVDVLSILESAVSPATTGSITVMQSPEFDGTMVILGQLSMTYRTSQEPSYIDEEIAMPSAEGSQTLRAVADSGEGSPLVSVSNLSAEGQHVTIKCVGGGDGNFRKSEFLLSGETLLTEACSERTVHGDRIESFSHPQSEAPHGPVGISITTNGMPGSIAAFGLQLHKRGQKRLFSNVTFTDPAMLMSPATVFDGVPVGTARMLAAGNYVPELSVTNFSAKDLHVQVQYSQTSIPTKQLPTLTIAAGSSKKVTFDDLQGDP